MNKTWFRLYITFPFIITVAGIFVACASSSHPPTPVIGQFKSPRVALVKGAKLDVAVGYYYLKEVDKLEGAERSTRDADHEKMQEVVRKQAPADVRVLTSHIKPYTRYFCEMRVHTYPPPWNLLGFIPQHSAVSLCVSAELRDNQKSQVIGVYGECGFPSKGFSGPFLSFAKLREVIISKVLSQVTDDFRRAVGKSKE